MSERPRQAYHQDYIARIRYSNALPPPPCPPKLLDIPNTGLSSGHYTSSAFATRLVREQPLNIEADAELGMPIDLVGIPGVFDGDESAIQASDKSQTIHPADRALLRPANALGKPATANSSISFLRRTEYTTSYAGGASKFESSNSSNTMRIRKRQRDENASRDDPAHILRHIQKSFNIAYPADASAPGEAAEASHEEKQAWRNPRHPGNPSLKVVDSYPLLPDWDALPDTGSYMMYKFDKAPVRDANGGYDERLDVALLRPIGETVADHERWELDMVEYKENPQSRPRPMQRCQFEFFLPVDRTKVRGIKRNFTTNDPDNEEEIPFEDGADEEGRPRKQFRYEQLRVYETKAQTGDVDHAFDDVLALALHDGESHEVERLRSTPLQKGAYFYPINQRMILQNKRGDTEMHGGEQLKVDVIETVARDAVEEKERRDALRNQYDDVAA
ncbi:Paf1-domain-containing protein [Sporormia fimetaria CBS 119925]|uniref:Paf1-domain-containing protein n=1 Tax=Sporormia fimetaria CBS 119925 TaxID=1340428 RepID=A0A6A6V6Z1_9PLEO|nr:Paf1-domain-containing protein [Sporormia fimetaria CBS 119925]